MLEDMFELLGVPDRFVGEGACFPSLFSSLFQRSSGSSLFESWCLTGRHYGRPLRLGPGKVAKALKRASCVCVRVRAGRLSGAEEKELATSILQGVEEARRDLAVSPAVTLQLRLRTRQGFPALSATSRRALRSSARLPPLRGQARCAGELHRRVGAVRADRHRGGAVAPRGVAAAHADAAHGAPWCRCTPRPLCHLGRWAVWGEGRCVWGRCTCLDTLAGLEPSYWAYQLCATHPRSAW